MSTPPTRPDSTPAPIPEMPFWPDVAARADIPFRVAWGALWMETRILLRRLHEDPRLSEAQRRGYQPRLETAVQVFAPPDEEEEATIRGSAGRRRRGRPSIPLGYQDAGELIAAACTGYRQLRARKVGKITCERVGREVGNMPRSAGDTYYEGVSGDTLMYWAKRVYGNEITWNVLCRIWES